MQEIARNDQETVAPKDGILRAPSIAASAAAAVAPRPGGEPTAPGSITWRIERPWPTILSQKKAAPFGAQEMTW